MGKIEGNCIRKNASMVVKEHLWTAQVSDDKSCICLQAQWLCLPFILRSFKCPKQDFTIGLWIQEKALHRDGQEVKGDLFGTAECTKGKASQEDGDIEKEHGYKNGTACEEELMEQLAKAETGQEKDDAGRG
ncbi:hypothetical protein WISP_132908 [Willisornis vidua]|uniref:Uncharacterized protein n=1 Tax=Willisornis vidua TaxID=1566151 RepID=A0ABQ9CP62_9PASS|nr:hypothetical protein WISP_132908 [Willisornis vidua]